ncbi:unnamed protein product [Camellia sinensis]
MTRLTDAQAQVRNRALVFRTLSLSLSLLGCLIDFGRRHHHRDRDRDRDTVKVGKMSRYHTKPRRRRHSSDSSDDYSSSDGEHDASNHTKR